MHKLMLGITIDLIKVNVVLIRLAATTRAALTGTTKCFFFQELITDNMLNAYFQRTNMKGDAMLC